MDARTEAVITRYVLTHLPLGDESPCGLTEDERDAVVLFMSCDDLSEIANSKPWQIVYTLKYRIGLCTPKVATPPPINNFRFGPIAHAVISFVQHELKKLEEGDE